MTHEPVWIRPEIVRAVHSRQLAEHGGTDGVRDEGLLDSALARPKNLFAYSSDPPDLGALAAAYAFGLVKNHPFVDGNKRTAFVVWRVFLMLNGEDLEATKEEKYLTFLRVADGSVSDEELSDWIRSHSRADTGEEDAEPTVDGP